MSPFARAWPLAAISRAAPRRQGARPATLTVAAAAAAAATAISGFRASSGFSATLGAVGTSGTSGFSIWAQTGRRSSSRSRSFGSAAGAAASASAASVWSAPFLAAKPSALRGSALPFRTQVRGLRVDRLDHAAIGVRDLEVTRAWMKNVMGMDTFRGDDPEFADDYLAMVRNGRAFVALLKLPEGEEPLTGSRSQRGHFAFRVSNEEFAKFRRNLPKLLETHRAHDAQSVEIEYQNYGVQQSLFFQDPDGNELEVTTWEELDRPEESDEGAFLRRALLLDVRSPQEFQQVALPKSLLVPHTELLETDSGAIERVLDAVEGDKNAEIAVYCAAGVRSATAKAILDSHGFTNVQNWVNIEKIVQSIARPRM